MTTASFTLAPHPAATAIPALAVTGEIDITNAAQFVRSVTDRAGAGPAIVDLSELRYLDSAGFAALDDLLARQPIRIVIRPHSKLRRAAALMCLPHHDTIDAAQSTWQPGETSCAT